MFHISCFLVHPDKSGFPLRPNSLFPEKMCASAQQRLACLHPALINRDFVNLTRRGNHLTPQKKPRLAGFSTGLRCTQCLHPAKRGNGTPTRRDFAKLNNAAIEIVASLISSSTVNNL